MECLSLWKFFPKEGDDVTVFLIAKGVECESLDAGKFVVTQQMRDFVDNGGKILACRVSLKSHQSEGSEMVPKSRMKDLYELVKESDKIVSF